jgi:capsular polysaccharide biosynthesis protein
VIISFLIIKKYTATATILPPNPQQETMFGMMSATMSGGLSNLGRMSGLISGSGTASDLFAAIMQSGRIKGDIINKYDLKREFKSKTFTDAGKMLDDITTIEVSGEGIVSVSVIYKNKKLAADIANSYVEELDKFNKETVETAENRISIVRLRKKGQNAHFFVEGQPVNRVVLQLYPYIRHVWRLPVRRYRCRRKKMQRPGFP